MFKESWLGRAPVGYFLKGKLSYHFGRGSSDGVLANGLPRMCKGELAGEGSSKILLKGEIELPLWTRLV
jgi:hypothetical protein